MHLGFGVLAVGGFATLAVWVGACWASVGISGPDSTVHLDHS